MSSPSQLRPSAAGRIAARLSAQSRAEMGLLLETVVGNPIANSPETNAPPAASPGPVTIRGRVRSFSSTSSSDEEGRYRGAGAATSSLLTALAASGLVRDRREGDHDTIAAPLSGMLQQHQAESNSSADSCLDLERAEHGVERGAPPTNAGIISPRWQAGTAVAAAAASMEPEPEPELKLPPAEREHQSLLLLEPLKYSWTEDDGWVWLGSGQPGGPFVTVKPRVVPAGVAPPARLRDWAAAVAQWQRSSGGDSAAVLRADGPEEWPKLGARHLRELLQVTAAGLSGA